MPHESSTIRWSESWKEAGTCDSPGFHWSVTRTDFRPRVRATEAVCCELPQRNASSSAPTKKLRVAAGVAAAWTARRERDGRRQREQPAAEAGHLFFIGRQVARLRDRRPRLRIACGRPSAAHSVCSFSGLALGWTIAAAALFVWPPRHAAARADAVVVLAGGRGPRLAKGVELVRRGVAPVLVVSDGWSPTWPEANRLCAGRPAPVAVACFHPAPYSTRGEAEAFARLAGSVAGDRS